MRTTLRLLPLALALFTCAGGKTPNSSTSADGTWLLKLATENIGESPTIEANRDLSFSLCWKDRESESRVPSVHFIIVRMSDHRIVEQGSATMGEVRWTGDYEVEVSHRQGQVQLARGPESNIRTINVSKYLDVVGR